MKIKYLMVSLLMCGTNTMAFSADAAPMTSYDLDKTHLMSVVKASGLNPTAFKSALHAYSWARSHHELGANKDVLTIIDFTLPSYDKRLWVVDLENDKILLNTYTTQGRDSGLTYATRFSNEVGSDESSLGLYVTSGEFVGHHGTAMKIEGLEPGINNNAYQRNVEIHSANYVTQQFISEYHRAGRSLGCFAVSPKIKNKLLGDIQGGSAIFAYATPELNDPIARA